MPRKAEKDAASRAQQIAAAIALHQPGKIYKRNVGLLGMSKSDLREIAETKHKGLPKKKKPNLMGR